MIHAAAAAASSAVGISLVLAAGVKVGKADGAREAMAFMKVPVRLQLPATIALATIELFAGLALLFLGSRVAAVAGLALLLPFTALLLVLARKAPTTRCGCLGDLGEVDHVVGVGRNILLVLLLVLASVEVPGRPTIMAVLAGVQVVILMLVVSTGLSVMRHLRARGSAA